MPRQTSSSNHCASRLKLHETWTCGAWRQSYLQNEVTVKTSKLKSSPSTNQVARSKHLSAASNQSIQAFQTIENGSYTPKITSRMSPRTDSYLSLCLEQACKSSQMQYRHGCIVVRGGKVIGRGYNDHRSGYDGGQTLRTGALSFSPASDTAKMAHKEKKRSDCNEL